MFLACTCQISSLDVRQPHIDLPVEPSRTQQRRVQNIHTVGGSQHHHALVGAEAVHLHQQLVQGLLPLVVSATQTAATLTAHGVDLVYEDDGRGALLGLLEQIPHTGGAYAYIHLHKVRAGDGQKLYSRLTGHRLGQQRLTGTRRAYQQHALGDMRPQVQILLGLPEELHDLPQLLLLLVGPGHILKRDLFLSRRTDLGLSKPGQLVLRPGSAAGHAVHEIHQQNEAQKRQHIRQQQLQPVGGVVCVIVIGGDNATVILLLHQLVEILIEQVEVVQVGGNGAAPLQLGRDPGVADGELLHLLL